LFAIVEVQCNSLARIAKVFGDLHHVAADEFRLRGALTVDGEVSGCAIGIFPYESGARKAAASERAREMCDSLRDLVCGVHFRYAAPGFDHTPVKDLADLLARVGRVCPDEVVHSRDAAGREQYCRGCAADVGQIRKEVGMPLVEVFDKFRLDVSLAAMEDSEDLDAVSGMLPVKEWAVEHS
jgi:hypothetical protein